MKEFEDSSMLSIPYVGQDTLIRSAHPTQHSRPSRPRLQNLPFRIFLATTISVAAVLVSLSICRALRSRDQGSGATRRRLAEGGDGMDEDEASIVEGCLELEEEMGVLGERAISTSEGDSSGRIAELEAMLSVAAKESMQGGLGADLQLQGQNLEGQISFESRYDERASVPAPSSPASVALRGPSGAIPALDPDSWINAVPSIGLPPGEQESDMPVGDTGEESSSWQLPIPYAPSYATNRERTGGLIELVDCSGIQQHPYVHLPVWEKGVVPRDVRVSRLFDERRRRLSSYVYLLTLRKLYAQETLNQKDADLLVNAVERLVTTSWLGSRREPKGPLPLFIVEVLGDYIITFDAIVCAIQLLGEHMQLPLWWDKYIESFDTEYILYAHEPRGGKKARFHRHLAERFMAALNIYKQGLRPHLQEVIALKKLLFCTSFGAHRYKHPRWDPWRKDGGCS
ncbi:hypothetical protein EPH_0065150 [Eimeria praecox]|uniref:Uncharacterized protein n=1 Tax=Eimeria praecox TaxID=51316 RepID=U6HB82_9EIME|nr:hypothetical protein EPH_0065150 [Eimeria praecox]